MKRKTKNLIIGLCVSFIASAIPAIIFQKYIEAIMFFFSHWFIREQFPKQYHHIVPAICRTITACVMFFGISFVLPVEWSLLSAIPICYFISWIGFLKKERDEFEIKCEELDGEVAQLLYDLKRYKQIDVYRMTEEELRAFAKSKGLSETICDTLVLKVIHNYKWVEIQKELNFSKDGIRYHKEQIIKKLGVDL